jgi:hypothetical protein
MFEGLNDNMDMIQAPDPNSPTKLLDGRNSHSGQNSTGRINTTQSYVDALPGMIRHDSM